MSIVGIDMRHEIDGLINQFGVKVLYQRKSKYIKCKCYNELHRTGDPDCKRCRGTGRIIGLEKHDCIEHDVNQGTAKNSVRTTELGQASKPSKQLYFRHKCNPSVKDIIYEVGWKSGRPTTLHAVYEVEYVDKVRGDNGRIEFYSVFVQTRPDLYEDAVKLINKLSRSKRL